MKRLTSPMTRNLRPSLNGRGGRQSPRSLSIMSLLAGFRNFRPLRKRAVWIKNSKVLRRGHPLVGGHFHGQGHYSDYIPHPPLPKKNLHWLSLVPAVRDRGPIPDDSSPWSHPLE